MPEFAREGTISISDIVQATLRPSRSVGPPDPDAPEHTWLRGVHLSPAPVSQVMAPPPQAPAAPLADGGAAIVGGAGPDDATIAAVVEQLAAREVVFLDSGDAYFNGEVLQLTEGELAELNGVMLNAYERVLADKARAARERRMQSRTGKRQEMQEASGAGAEVVPPVH